MEWLISPLDTLRGHEIDFYVSWHTRLMVAAWIFIFPFGILLARFFKIFPGQDWPNQLDNKIWWYGYLFLQYSGGAIVLLGLLLLWQESSLISGIGCHRAIGWLTIVLCAIQFLSGLTRGSKSGLTDKVDQIEQGDHYDMTVRRKVFENIHKNVGCLAVVCALITIYSGLWTDNAARWMWILITLWWILLVGYAFLLQRKRLAVDTYQSIWGQCPRHPGNLMKPIGWGINRRKH